MLIHTCSQNKPSQICQIIIREYDVFWSYNAWQNQEQGRSRAGAGQEQGMNRAGETQEQGKSRRGAEAGEEQVMSRAEQSRADPGRKKAGAWLKLGMR